MITLYRKFKLWQIRTKWQLAMWQFIDKQLVELIKNPDDIQEKIMPYLADIIAKTNKE